MTSVQALILAVSLLVVLATVASVLLVRHRRQRRRQATLLGRREAADGAELVADDKVGRVVERVVERPEVRPELRPRLRDRLGRARDALGASLASILDRATISEDTWDELLEALIRADVGLSTSVELTDAARSAAEAEGLTTPEEAIAVLRDQIQIRLAGSRDLARRTDGGLPSVWLFVGVNGSGKTTSIGKLAKQEIGAGAQVVLAAGDTFRAAASEQLEAWAQRSGADIVKGAAGADPASVVYDAVQSAAAKGSDLVMADTAGRLHTERNLMDELRKVRRVAEKGEGVVTETLLVLDATAGQNGLAQARQFTKAVDITGVILTKLDGSAKGGIVVAVQAELGIPVKLVGLGEGEADLVVFDAEEFADALFS